MKTNVMRMFLALGTVSLFGSALNAQSYEMAANVPFTFQVDNQTFAPGKYLVKRDFMGAPSLKTVASGHKIFIPGAYPSLSGKNPAKLVFHRYGGDQYFLAEIWPAGAAGSAVPTSKTEQALMRGDRSRQMATIAVDLHRAD